MNYKEILIDFKKNYVGMNQTELKSQGFESFTYYELISNGASNLDSSYIYCGQIVLYNLTYGIIPVAGPSVPNSAVSAVWSLVTGVVQQVTTNDSICIPLIVFDTLTAVNSAVGVSVIQFVGYRLKYK